MRKSTILLLAAIAAVALPSYARDRSHSYITYDDGDSSIRQSEDGRDVDTRLNMPVFPGDQVTTGRRGRIEIRMADGNVIALDRSTSVEFKSILDSYDGDSEQTIVELHYGHVAFSATTTRASSSGSIPRTPAMPPATSQSTPSRPIRRATTA